MAELSRAMASLRVMGEDLIPDEVSFLLGARPSVAYARGDDISSRRGLARVAKFGLWTYQAQETGPADVDAQVAELLGQLTPDVQVWRQLAGRFDMDLFCGWFMERANEGLDIAPDTLMSLAERRIALSLDIYGAENEEEGGRHLSTSATSRAGDRQAPCVAE
jgi:hypothetical protein